MLRHAVLFIEGWFFKVFFIGYCALALSAHICLPFCGIRFFSLPFIGRKGSRGCFLRVFVMLDDCRCVSVYGMIMNVIAYALAFTFIYFLLNFCCLHIFSHNFFSVKIMLALISCVLISLLQLLNGWRKNAGSRHFYSSFTHLINKNYWRIKLNRPNPIRKISTVISGKIKLKNPSRKIKRGVC